MIKPKHIGQVILFYTTTVGAVIEAVIEALIKFDRDMKSANARYRK